MHYLKPKIKKIKKLGILLPGFKIKFNKKFSVQKKSEYGKRLQEKQKIKFNYGLSEIEIYNYIKKIQYKKNRTLLKSLEMRLDNIIYRLGFAKTIIHAKQLINHGKIFINNKKISFANFICRIKDIIVIKNHKKKDEKIKNYTENKNLLPKYLIKLQNYKALIKKNPSNKEILIKINERLIIEFYAKK